VNLLVDHGEAEGAPVVYEDRPSVDRLLGSVEHRSQLGNLVSDFTLIKAGALHAANGGYLMLDARKVLTLPQVWSVLKRALFSEQVHIESLPRLVGLSGPAGLEPEPIPLDVKVVLVGPRKLYYLLAELDPETGELFKVVADFEDELERTDESELHYGRLVAGIAKQQGLRAFDRAAVALLIEQSARAARDREKLSTNRRRLGDLMTEAEHYACERGDGPVVVADVQRAIDARIHRLDRLRGRVQEMILEDTVLIDTEGSRVAQINGLAVRSFGGFAFGAPSRITATVRIGKGELVDIEREVELGGSSHSKGVLILASYFAARYSRWFPLSLRGSLVFEQSYGGADGDSASLAEVCALLSALADAPIRQDLAVTGSVNQLGQVQAIGGVNEKVEGFFDICERRGLTGGQGVLIPWSNRRHLMLRPDVVEACEAGQFAVYPVRTVDEAVALLCSEEPGVEDEQGSFPEGSLNQRVLEQLMEFTVTSVKLSKLVGADDDERGKDDGAGEEDG
jgi:lon-related putative ATP-dependent protease